MPAPPSHISDYDPRFFRTCTFPLLRRLGYGTRVTINNGLPSGTPSATAKAGREPTDWLPRKAFRCSYLAQYVAVKWRWRLAVDGAERTDLRTRLAGCGWPKVRLPSRPVIRS